MGQRAGTTSSGLRNQVFTASGSFKVPAGITKLFLTGCGGGGSGGRRLFQDLNGGGGGGGGFVTRYPVSVTAGATYTVTIGAGGIWGSTDGGDTIFEGLLNIAGGISGVADSATGGAGGSAFPTMKAGETGQTGGTLGSGGNGGRSMPLVAGGTPATSNNTAGGNAPANSGAGGGGGCGTGGGGIGGTGLLIVEW